MTFATVVTEFGYHTNPAASADGVDRATQAKNLLNAMLGAWAEGYRGFFIYELYDAATDASDLSNYGLFDTQGRPKPSGRAIHALTALLADRGPDATTFNPGTIAMTLSGLSATARWTTLQDSEGAYRFIIWNNAPNWDAASRQPMTVLPRTVTLELARSWSRVTIFDPVQGTDAVRHFANVKRITLSLTDHPLVVAVSERDSK
jgi:hypothetical protein